MNGRVRIREWDNSWLVQNRYFRVPADSLDENEGHVQLNRLKVRNYIHPFKIIGHAETD